MSALTACPHTGLVENGPFRPKACRKDPNHLRMPPARRPDWVLAKLGRSLEKAVDAHGRSATSRDLDERELGPHRSGGGNDRGAAIDPERLEQRPEPTLTHHARPRRDVE